MEFSDRELAAEILSGSSVAFETLMHRYERLVYRVAFGWTGSRESALEIVQETFLAVHSRLGSYRGEGELKSWIARIAANAAMNRARGERLRSAEALDEAAIPSVPAAQEMALAERERSGALHRSLDALPPRQRTAVVLRYFEEMPIHDIAIALECNEGTARSILFRSLVKLRHALSGVEEVER